MSVKSKQSSKKSSSGKKEKKKKIEDSDEDFESSEEELDLTKECHPIGYYIHDRAEMINQMFSVIKGNKLKAMLPPILKDCDIEQLKLQCLDQLLGMSDKRITYLLEGEILETSSESEVMESDECESDEKNGTSGSNSDRSEDSQDVESIQKKRKGDFINEYKSGKLSKSESEPPEQGKTLLEILELEMRARAIRALLKQSGNDKGNDIVSEEPKSDLNKVKEISDEVVDLTECEDEEFPACTKKEKMDNRDSDIRTSNFREKIENSKVEKPGLQEDEKLKKLQAELELRNKLFKKKIYRTRQQRMENEEEEKNVEKNPDDGNNSSRSDKVLIKQEPEELEELVVEDPEEGEINTSEDDNLVEIEKELPVVAERKDDFETKNDNNFVKIIAIDSGMFVSNSDLENIVFQQESKEDSVDEMKDNVFIANQNKMQQSKFESMEDGSDTVNEETSWRDRWFQKDGVQKLVKSSKIFAKVKKRIAEKSQKTKEEIPVPCDVNFESNNNSKPETIIGSIEEYERLLSRNQEEKKDDSIKNENLAQSTNSERIIETSEDEKVKKT